MTNLPTTRVESLEWYIYLLKEAKLHQLTRDTERWLGRNDLFYLMVRLLRRPDINKDWLFERCREVERDRNGYLDLWAREHGKALALDTPIRTTKGWRQHGELVVGDCVFGPDGLPTPVIAVSKVFNYEDEYSYDILRPQVCYRLCFEGPDGQEEKIVAGAKHLWKTSARAKSTRRLFRPKLKTTHDLYYDVFADRLLNDEECAIPPIGERPEFEVRYICDTDPVPISCIQVGRRDGMYLVGKSDIPTHNSSCVTFGLTIQDILRDPEITVGIFSHTKSIAEDFLVQIKREFETNEHLKRVYSDILWANPHKDAPVWSSNGIIVKRKGNPKEATVEAWGLVEGQPTGRHFRLRVYDDVVVPKSVFTPEQIEKTTKAWELSLNLGMQEDQGGASRYIGTRYNLSDTYSVMMSRNAVIPRVYPATHNGRFDGRPVLFTDEEWQKRLNDASRQTIAAQMLQNPMADTDATFRTEWLKSYEVRPRTLNVYLMADPSRGRSATSDNTAIAVVGIASNGAKFLLDALCHRMTLSQRWVALRNLYRKWSRAKGVQHIAVGYERFGAQSDDEYFLERMQLEKLHFGIDELNWTGDGTVSKQQRVERLEPDFRNGRFFLPLPVWHEGRACTWRVDVDAESKTFGEVQYRDVGGLTSQQMSAVSGGSPDLIAKAIKAVDQDGRVYDVTKHFISEYSTFPFGGLKDLVDAASRIYDMRPTSPMLVSHADTEPPQFFDS